MQIVINVSEEIMEYVKNNGCLSVIYNDEVAKAITNGTPLPNGHGDLIDRKELLSHEKCTYRYDCPGSSCDKCSDNCIEVRDIENAKPVIEADKESEE